jgi:hypothetical protein
MGLYWSSYVLYSAVPPSFEISLVEAGIDVASMVKRWFNSTDVASIISNLIMPL